MFKTLAGCECLASDGGDVNTNCDADQTAAGVERRIPDCDDTIRYRDASKAVATTECQLSDDGNAAWNCTTIQFFAHTERRIADAADTAWNCDDSQACAPFERLFSDAGDRQTLNNVWDYKVVPVAGF